MKATCPTNPEHKTFITVAHISEMWTVDPEGNWLDTHEDTGEVVAFPDPGNTWTCKTCGVDANVED